MSQVQLQQTFIFRQWPRFLNRQNSFVSSVCLCRNDRREGTSASSPVRSSVLFAVGRCDQQLDAVRRRACPQRHGRGINLRRAESERHFVQSTGRGQWSRVEQGAARERRNKVCFFFSTCRRPAKVSLSDSHQSVIVACVEHLRHEQPSLVFPGFPTQLSLFWKERMLESMCFAGALSKE